MVDARIAAPTAAAARNSDVLVVMADAAGDVRGKALPAAQRRAVAAAVAAVGEAEVLVLPGSVIDRGGSIIVSRLPESGGAEAVRRCAGTALMSVTQAARVAVVCPDDHPETVGATAEGARLGAYRFTRYRDLPRIRSLTVLVTGPDREQRAAVKRANVVADGVCLARDLVNTAPNDLGPEEMTAIARAEADRVGASVKVWDDRALRRGGFGGLTAVGQGSARGPRLVRVEHRPARSRGTLALVGKGITFDSGGLSLKPAKAMEWMKSDMGGAAAVLAAVVTASRLDLPVTVVGWLALAENMPSGTAQRPGDVITIRGGTTVEVLNTDAEGRLVLADALVTAGAEQPDAILDVATLTGAQLVALGSRVAGVMGNDDRQRTAVVTAGDDAGESLWAMPLPPELRASLDSTVADLANIGDRNGGMLTAAVFLQQFVPADTPWTHLDIAGPAFNEGAPHDYTPKGGTGFAVRTLVSFLDSFAARPQH